MDGAGPICFASAIRLAARHLALAAAALLAAATLAGVAAASATASFPQRGVLVPGKSLAGVQLGDSQATVKARWGGRYRVCSQCGEPTWYFIYDGPKDEPLGAGVTFRAGKVAAVFTLGSPTGWHTTQGLLLGEQIDRVRELYGSLKWRLCIGYGALTMRKPGVVTSIYTNGEAVYGFALTRPYESVCQ